ncbi:MAG: type II toxin-antitoxin system VapB family antitoxin [Gemmatimonadetes bacterium]|jgi:hypothetical protein|nr:type II toxin-antitoxin system VapB family antitoxin [Gemmatimonadota bacterium]
MRTTIRLDDQLLIEAKQFANQTSRTLTTVIEDALRESLARRHAIDARDPVCLTTVKGNGVQAGVDLDDTSSLLDLMDQPRDPH